MRPFFKSPLKYLESQQALPSLETAKGHKLPLIQEEALVQTIRKARDLYKGGKLELRSITASEENTTKQEWVSMSHDKSWNPDSYAMQKKTEGANIRFAGVSSLEIDGRLIGPLADPKVLEKLRAGVEAELKKVKG